MNIENLISAVFIRAALWDQKDRNHHNRYILDKQWDEVAQELKITREIARAKWKTLRDKFRLTLSKIPPKKSGDEGEATQYSTVTWSYFHNLLFLKDQFTPRKSTGNLPMDSQDEDLFPLEHDNTLEVDEDEEHADSASMNSPLPSPISTEAPSPTSASGEKNNSGLRKRVRPNDLLGQAILNVETEKLNYLKSKQPRRSEEHDDEDLHFFKSLMPHVRDFSSAQKMGFRIKILQYIQEIVESNKTESRAPNYSTTTENNSREPSRQQQYINPTYDQAGGWYYKRFPHTSVATDARSTMSGSSTTSGYQIASSILNNLPSTN